MSGQKDRISRGYVVKISFRDFVRGRWRVRLVLQWGRVFFLIRRVDFFFFESSTSSMITVCLSLSGERFPVSSSVIVLTHRSKGRNWSCLCPLWLYVYVFYGFCDASVECVFG